MDPRTEKMLAERQQKEAAVPPHLRRPLRALNGATTWVKTHTLAAKVGTAALAVVFFAAYAVFVSLPAQRRDRMQIDARAAEHLKTETTAGQVATADCLSKAQAEADARWTAACKAKREGAGCTLPWRQTGALEREESEARNSCLMQVPPNTR
jgi:hypothetical protein